VLAYFRQAVALDSTLGNAYGFLGIEYGARAGAALRAGNIAEMRKQLRLGKDHGGYPPWLIEYNRNILRSVPHHALLFVGGDTELNPLRYLQAVEGYRTDVTVLSVPAMDRPSHVAVYEHGIPGVMPPAPMNLTDTHIQDAHPYKWQPNLITIPLPNLVQKRYTTEKDMMQWQVAPDMQLTTNTDRTFLSVKGAVVIDILRTNQFQRPVFYSLGTGLDMRFGLDAFARTTGLAMEITPVQHQKKTVDINPERTAQVMLSPDHFMEFQTYATLPMPRFTSGLQNYFAVYAQLLRYYKQQGDQENIEKIMDFIETHFSAEVYPPVADIKRQLRRFVHSK
jgi:hypothetical protein